MCTAKSAAGGKANAQPDTVTADYFDTANSDSNQSMNCNRNLGISVACTDRNTTASCFYC